MTPGKYALYHLTQCIGFWFHSIWIDINCAIKEQAKVSAWVISLSETGSLIWKNHKSRVCEHMWYISVGQGVCVQASSMFLSRLIHSTWTWVYQSVWPSRHDTFTADTNKTTSIINQCNSFRQHETPQPWIYWDLCELLLPQGNFKQAENILYM